MSKRGKQTARIGKTSLVDPDSLRWQAAERSRCRCYTETEYSHDNLAEYLLGALPSGWKVVAPPEGVDAPSGYPEDAGEESQAALKALYEISECQEAGEGEEEGREGEDWEDMINGHCELCAAVLSQYVLQEVAHAEPGAALQRAYDALSSDLQGSDKAGQIGILFGQRAGKKDRAAMWRGLPGQSGEVLAAVSLPQRSPLAAGQGDLVLAQIASVAKKTEVRLVVGPRSCNGPVDTLQPQLCSSWHPLLPTHRVGSCLSSCASTLHYCLHF